MKETERVKTISINEVAEGRDPNYRMKMTLVNRQASEEKIQQIEQLHELTGKLLKEAKQTMELFADEPKAR